MSNILDNKALVIYNNKYRSLLVRFYGNTHPIIAIIRDMYVEFDIFEYNINSDDVLGVTEIEITTWSESNREAVHDKLVNFIKEQE